MKLSLINEKVVAMGLLLESTLPSWLKDLYANYWRLRRAASERCRRRNGYSDAEICQDVTAYFAHFLAGKGIETVDAVGYNRTIGLHAWNEADRDDGRWVIDGSWYQSYSDKPWTVLGLRLGERLEAKLARFEIVLLEELLRLVDFADGRKPVWNTGTVESPKREEIGVSATNFSAAEIDAIKGRLLPFMVRVHLADGTYNGKRRGTPKREFGIIDVTDDY